MNAFDHLDGWFEKRFRVRQQKAAETASATRRDAVRSRAGGPGPARRGSVAFSAEAKAKNIKSVIRKAPEVMLKITGSSNGLLRPGGGLHGALDGFGFGAPRVERGRSGVVGANLAHHRMLGLARVEAVPI